MEILVTGAAGFIGTFTVEELTRCGYTVFGVDSINDYYDVNLKLERLKKCGIEDPEYGKIIPSSSLPGYSFVQADICDVDVMEHLFQTRKFAAIVHLAAQAGVRYSLINPMAYVKSNMEGFCHILEHCRKYGCDKLIYASSSSVYGNNSKIPFNENEPASQPVSLYAASKKSNELMAYTYSHLYGIETIGLRFFTVYGPYGRPDMAPMLFASAISENRPIKIYNHGDLSRDFTYIGDIVTGIEKIVSTIVSRPIPEQKASVYNIGHGSPVQLMEFIGLLEKYMGKEAIKEYVEMQPGDVYTTWADTGKLRADFGYSPSTSLEEGISKFIEWFKK